jgi:hypothetical protein
MQAEREREHDGNGGVCRVHGVTSRKQYWRREGGGSGGVGNKRAQMEDQDGEMNEGKTNLSMSVGGGKSYREFGRRARGERKTEIPQAVKGTPTEVLLIFVSDMIVALPSSSFLRHKKWSVEMDHLSTHNSPVFFSILDPSKGNPPEGYASPSHGCAGCIYDVESFSPVLLPRLSERPLLGYDLPWTPMKAFGGYLALRLI